MTRLEQAQSAVMGLRERLDTLNADRVRFHTNLTESEGRERELRASRGDFRELAQARGEIEAAKDLLADTERESAEVRAALADAQKVLEREQDLVQMVTSSDTWHEGTDKVFEILGELAQVTQPYTARLLEAAAALDGPEQAYNAVGKRLLPGYVSRIGTGQLHWEQDGDGLRSDLEAQIQERGGQPIKPLQAPQTGTLEFLLFQLFVSANHARKNGSGAVLFSSPGVKPQKF